MADLRSGGIPKRGLPLRGWAKRGIPGDQADLIAIFIAGGAPSPRPEVARKVKLQFMTVEAEGGAVAGGRADVRVIKNHDDEDLLFLLAAA